MLYHVSIFPLYDAGVGPELRGTVTTCKADPAPRREVQVLPAAGPGPALLPPAVPRLVDASGFGGL